MLLVTLLIVTAGSLLLYAGVTGKNYHQPWAPIIGMMKQS